MVQTTIHINEDQKRRIGEMPRNVSFSQIIREHFDYIMYDIEHKNMLDVKAV